MPKQIYVVFFLNKISPQENVDIGKIKKIKKTKDTRVKMRLFQKGTCAFSKILIVGREKKKIIEPLDLQFILYTTNCFLGL